MKDKIRVECPTCGGTGVIEGCDVGIDVDCGLCQGTGQIWDYPEDPEFDPEDE